MTLDDAIAAPYVLEMNYGDTRVAISGRHVGP
jgi:hypothetical protein